MAVYSTDSNTRSVASWGCAWLRCTAIITHANTTFVYAKNTEMLSVLLLASDTDLFANLYMRCTKMSARHTDMCLLLFLVSFYTIRKSTEIGILNDCCNDAS